MNRRPPPPIPTPMWAIPHPTPFLIPPIVSPRLQHHLPVGPQAASSPVGFSTPLLSLPPPQTKPLQNPITAIPPFGDPSP